MYWWWIRWNIWRILNFNFCKFVVKLKGDFTMNSKFEKIKVLESSNTKNDLARTSTFDNSDIKPKSTDSKNSVS